MTLCAVLFLTVSFQLVAEGFTKLRQIDCRLAPHTRVKTKKLLDESESSNWSGYAALTDLAKPKVDSVTFVAGKWIVPQLKKTNETTFSSIWVGIDGYGSPSVQQIGTEHDWQDGKQQDYAWFEMFPKGSYQIVGFPVKPGDVIGAEVKYQGNDTYKLTLSNHTQKVYTVVPSKYTKAKKTKRLSAEWVVEAPSDGTKVLPLADFEKVGFTECQATINGKKGAIDNKRWKEDELVMATGGRTVKAKPTTLTNSGKDFAVSWSHE